MLGPGGLASGGGALREVATTAVHSAVAEHVVRLQRSQDQDKDRLAGQLIEDLKLLSREARAQDRSLVLVKSVLEATGYALGTCADTERMDSVLDNLQDHKVPLRLLNRKHLTTAYSNFTRKLAGLDLVPFSLNPRFLPQSQIQSLLVRHELGPKERRIAGQGVSLIKGNAARVQLMGLDVSNHNVFP